jgi:hypothetical protein
VTARAALLLLAVLPAACGGGEAASPAPAYPPGTALAVGGAPIPAAEIEAAAERVRLLYPDRTPSFHATQALQTFVLPRAALQHAFAERRAQARADCDAALERIRSGLEPAAEERTGRWGELSLLVWDAARLLAPGEWSAPLEDLGGFSLVRLERRSGFERHPAEEVLTVNVLEFSYLPPVFEEGDVAAAMAAARLEVVDPAYADLVPETLRYRMKGPEREGSKKP